MNSNGNAAMTGYKNEEILPDDYPVYVGYAYVIKRDDEYLPVASPLQGNVADLKREFKTAEIHRCNLFDRGLM